MNKFYFSAVIFLMFSFYGYSQTNPSSASPIQEKFSDLIESSNDFKGYKVVDYEKLTDLQQNTEDRIESLKSEITDFQESIQTKEEKIAALEAELLSMQTQLKEVTAEKDAISFLGMPFDKSSYKTIMWSIVAILILALAYFVYRYKTSHFHTREAQKNLEATEKELEAFRIKALEKEQRLGRLLQDERNKLLKVAK